MRRTLVVLTLAILARGVPAAAQPCDERLLRDPAETARFNIIAAVDGAEAIRAWRNVLGHGGSVG